MSRLTWIRLAALKWGRRFRFPLLLLGFGLLVNVFLHVGGLRASEARAAEALDQGAMAFSSHVEEIVEHGLVQAAAFRGLFQASEEVTSQEFEAFAHIVGGPPVSLLGFARIVPAEDLDIYLAETRSVDPSFYVFERAGASLRPVSSREYLLPIHYAESLSALAEDRGFDLASDPIRMAAVEEALKTGEPAFTGFVELPGDDTPGDVEVFLSVGDQSGEPAGLVFAVLQIDEHLTTRAPDTLPAGVTWRLTEIDPASSVPLIRRPDLWQGTIELSNASFGLELQASPDLLQREREGHLATLITGLVAAVLAALALHFFIQQLRSRDEVARLREITKQKDRFLAGVSHELRTPITSVLGLLEILADNRQNLPDHEANEYVELARQEAKELADLVEDLLTAGRLSAGTLSVVAVPIDLVVQVRRVVDRISVPNRMRVRIDEHLGSVWADPLRIRQILRNLVTNAIRYGHRSVDIKAIISDEETRLEVRNDGPPIPVAMRDRIFEPFQTAESQPTQPDSIGLGLSISRQLARAMGGNLTYAYSGGQSIFALTIPSSHLELTEEQSVAKEPVRS